jgi:hypothetical protein
MTDSIFDALRADVHAALTDDARAGTLRREVSGGLDEWGDPLPAVVTNHGFRGWRDAFDAQWHAAGIPLTDARIVVLAQSIAVAPVQGDKLNVESRWWQVSRVETDPAGAAWVCQAFEVSAPT